ncbi:MAG: (2Fe-2S) ferredoxin domain-containing protein [Ilumatobacteraceae bacterium]
MLQAARDLAEGDLASSVAVSPTGCMGLCSAGPLLAWWSAVAASTTITTSPAPPPGGSCVTTPIAVRPCPSTASTPRCRSSPASIASCWPTLARSTPTGSSRTWRTVGTPHWSGRSPR